MIEFIIGIGCGILFIWILSKYYCFQNKIEWNKFKRKWLQQQ